MNPKLALETPNYSKGTYVDRVSTQFSLPL